MLLKSTVCDCSIIELDIKHCKLGNITEVNNRETIPFDIQRIYYLYGVPGSETRGGHAHKDLKQLLVATCGCFDVVLDDGQNKKNFTLNQPYQGLIIVPGIWRDLGNFSSGSVCLVLASAKYDERDYIRDYAAFRTFKSL